jgi:hypothetical protein
LRDRASQTSLFKVNKLDDTSLFSIDSTGLVSITENVLIAKNLTVTGTLTGNATTATTAKKLDATENSNLNSKPLYLANGSDQNALDYATIFTNNGSAFGPRLYGRDGGELGTYKDSLYAKALVWNRAGMVGIGTVTPSRAKLEVVGSVSTSNNNIGAYFNRDAAVNLSGGASAQNAAYNLSLYCSNNIVCDTLMAFSDARIKHIQGRSDGAADLATLTRIEITDYTHKDVVTKDSRPHKKVIAQQVETVYPQAVSRGTDVVPDIYQKAEFKDGWVKLATSLKVGERVRLIGEKEEAIHEVLEVRDGAFRTAFQPPTNEVFVYGREVKDFRSVDYDAIAMLNVSATQQVKKELDAEVTKRDAEIKELRAENATLQAALEKAQASFETRLAALEKALPESGAEGAVKTVSTSTQQPVVSAAN